MKKLMRIALVFALAGATLVGCTKDYSGDISDLNKRVSEQSAAVTALQSAVANAQTAADAAAQRAAEALAEAQKKASSADVQAAEERVNAKINDLVNGDVKALKDAVAALEGIKADERLTDLETAIKDFVTKAELAQELAALKGELEEAIAAGDKVNADAIAALEKKVEDILASLNITDVKVYSEKDITAAYGKFTATGVKNAAKWKGPKADEIAKIKKGDFVFGTGADEILVKVNPTDADITDAEISLQTSECVEAPIAFGTPVPYEGKLPTTKASDNGLWSLPFVVEEFTEEEASDIYDEFHNAAMALVVNDVRTDYDLSFAIVEGTTTTAVPVAITEKVAEASGEGTFVFKPADAPQILDAYITDVADADSLRFGITYDGMSFTYDVDKVQKWVESQKKPLTIRFAVSYMNLVGGTAAKTGVLTIEYKSEDPVAPTVYQFAAEAAHDAVAYHGTTNAEKEASRAEQALVVDFKEFFDEFAPTKAEKALWLEDWDFKGVTFYTAKYNDYDELELEAKATGLVEESGFDPTVSKFAIQFEQDYGTAAVAKLDGKDHFAAVITFENDEEEIIKAIVPFKINAPSATEIAKWYDWNKKGLFANGVLYATPKPTYSGGSYVQLAENFRAKGDYNVSFAPQILTKYKADGTTVDYRYPKPFVNTGCSPAEAESTKNMDATQKLEYYSGSSQYLADLNKDFNAVKWSEGYGSNKLATKSAYKDTDNKVVKPYQYRTESGVPTAITDLTLSLAYDQKYKSEYENTTMQIDGLTVQAMGRIFDIPALDFQIVGQAPAASCSIEFTRDVELGRAPNTLIDLYHKMYTPNHEPGEYFGAFTLKDENGQALKLNAKTNPYAIHVATSLKADGTPNWKNNNNLIDISAFEYTSQIDENGEVTTVFGLEISNKGGRGLDNLLPSEDTIYVEITYNANTLHYVLTNNAYTRQYKAVFEIKVK